MNTPRSTGAPLSRLVPLAVSLIVAGWGIQVAASYSVWLSAHGSHMAPRQWFYIPFTGLLLSFLSAITVRKIVVSRKEIWLSFTSLRRDFRQVLVGLTIMAAAVALALGLALLAARIFFGRFYIPITIISGDHDLVTYLAVTVLPLVGGALVVLPRTSGILGQQILIVGNLIREARRLGDVDDIQEIAAVLDESLRSGVNADRTEVYAEADALAVGLRAIISLAVMERIPNRAVFDEVMADYLRTGAGMGNLGFFSDGRGRWNLDFTLTLGRCLIRRFSWDGSRDSLDTAIDLLLPSCERPGWILRRVFPTTLAETTADLCAALALRRRGDDVDHGLLLAARVNRRDRALLTPVRARLALLRYEAAPDAPDVRRSLDESLSWFDDSEPHPWHVRALLHTGDLDDRRRALEVAREGLDGQLDGSPHRSTWLTAFAQAMNEHERGSDQVFAALRDAAGSDSAPLADQAVAARVWTDTAIGAERWDEALAALDRGIELSTQAASIGLGFADQISLVARWPGLAADAAAVCLRSGDVRRAVELLEAGRGVVWSQLARSRRTVGRQPDPDVAERLARIRAELDALWTPDQDETPDSAIVATVPATAVRSERRLALGREWAALTSSSSFPSRTPYADLRAAAAEGPVVIVNVSRIRCDAIIVRAEGEPVQVDLPRLRHSEVVRWSESFGRDALPLPEADHILAELWEAVLLPVLSRLEPLLGPDRRVWWCPTGPLVGLPFHVSHLGRAPADHTASTLVSSFVPTLAALIQARRAPRPAGPAPSALLVSLERTPDRDGHHWSDLPGAPQEIDNVTRLVGVPSIHLADERATVDAVVRALPGARFAHFVCHGYDRGLALHDRDLGVARLSTLDLSGADLAYLSSCSTAAPDRTVHDESVNPVMVLFLNGFRHVIGTVRPVDRQHASVLSEVAYAALTRGGRLDSARAAVAAREMTVAAWRDRDPDDAAPWSVYLHVGV